MRVLATAIVVLLGTVQPGIAQNGPGAGAVGATIDELVAIARKMNPELQVMTLEAEAAQAKVEGAGSLMDPKIQYSIEDWTRNRPGYFPSNPADALTKKIRLTQEFPFWGKRDLRREIAEANARKAAVLKRQVENELVTKVKIAYAENHAAHLSVDLARDLRARRDTLARLAHARYGQGLGRQQDVTRAEVEKSMLDAEIARMEGERQKARTRINRLLARPLDAPLAEASAARPIPAVETLDVATLAERAQRSNPDILVQLATIEGSDSALSLAQKSWYPDFEVSVGAVRKEGDWQGYEAMLQMNIPLQWGLRDSEIGETKAMAAAARARREMRAQEIGNEVADAWIALKTARQIEKLVRENQLPQAEIGFQAAARSYELGRTEFLDVLMTEQQLWRANIELVKVLFDQQVRLAEIEELIGGEL